MNEERAGHEKVVLPFLIAGILISGGYFAKELIEASQSRAFQDPYKGKANDGIGVDVTKFLKLPLERIAGKRTLLVMMGTCGSCSRKQYKRGTESASFSLVIEAWEGSLKDVPNSANDRFIVAQDKNGELHQVLKAYSPPRMYKLDETGRVVLAYVEGSNEKVFLR